MKVFEKQVKTVYRIALRVSDIAEMYVKKQGKYTPFKMPFANLKGTTMGELRDYVKKLPSMPERVDTLDFIADELGYDGVENYGYYKESTGEYRFSAFMYGDN